MHWLVRAASHPFAHIATDLQRAVALAESQSTRAAAVQLERSLIRLASIEQLLQLRVQWGPEQARRQQQRLARQQARVRWQQATLEQLWEGRQE